MTPLHLYWVLPQLPAQHHCRALMITHSFQWDQWGRNVTRRGRGEGGVTPLVVLVYKCRRQNLMFLHRTPFGVTRHKASCASMVTGEADI